MAPYLPIRKKKERSRERLDTLLNEKDWAVDPCGNPIAVSGWEEELQRCRIRLQVPKGAFPYQPELGSGLHALAAGGLRRARHGACPGGVAPDAADPRAPCFLPLWGGWEAHWIFHPSRRRNLGEGGFDTNR